MPPSRLVSAGWAGSYVAMNAATPSTIARPTNWRDVFSSGPIAPLPALALVGAVVAWVGALVGAIVVVLPGAPLARPELVFAAAAGAAVLGAALALARARAGQAGLHAAVFVGTLLGTLGVLGWGSEHAFGPLGYAWVVVAAFVFFPAWQSLLHVASVAVVYALAMVFDRGGVAWNAWFATVTALAGAGAIVTLARIRATALLQQLEEAAGRDPLTGLANRRSLQDAFDIELERARRTGRPLAVLLVDIDHFKRVNDRCGHQCGDEVLRTLARVLQASKRGFDLAARHGGEEFVLLAPDCDEHGAYMLAERLRTAVERAFADHQAGPVTVSIGAAVHPVHGQTFEALLNAADEAMYAAKKLGRNRTVISSAEIERAAELDVTAGGRVELAALIDLAEAVDMATIGNTSHCQRVARFAELAARELGLPAHRVEQVRLAALLHDVGTIAIPDEIERKKGPLTYEEWEFVRAHPVVGSRMLEVTEHRELGRWIRAHHEHLDGSGYPDGLSGADVPLEARIIAVAEAYEAMTSDRPYRPRLTHREAVAELRSAAGQRFDTEVVEALVRALG